jgi:hypothetical protein
LSKSKSCLAQKDWLFDKFYVKMKGLWILAKIKTALNSLSKTCPARQMNPNFAKGIQTIIRI